MFPIVLDIKTLSLLLAGNGKATLRRLELLNEAGAEKVKVFADQPSDELRALAGARLIERLPEAQDFEGINFAMVADFDNETTAKLYALAKQKNIPVNTEDKKDYCDYHVPAIVRRGELLLTVSTGGGSPRLARRLRQWLSGLFVTEWDERLKFIASQRNEWRKQGVGFKELAEKTDAILDEKGWLKELSR